jgi:hypothetical protein
MARENREAVVAHIGTGPGSKDDVSDLNAAVDELLGFYPLSAGGDFTSNYDVYTAVATDRYAFHMMIEEYAPCLRRLTCVVLF